MFDAYEALGKTDFDHMVGGTGWKADGAPIARRGTLSAENEVVRVP